LSIKICKYCNTEKLLEDFVVNKHSRGGRTNECKSCRRVRHRKYKRNNRKEKDQRYYIRNKDRLNLQRRTIHYQFIKKCILFKEEKCEICGLKTDYYEVYDFHHKNSDEKEFIITGSVFMDWETKVVPELNKCDLLCRNCHTLLTYQETRSKPAVTYRQKWSRAKQDSYKSQCVTYLRNYCQICGLETEDIVKYDFHHVDPTTKESDITNLVGRDWDTVVRPELDKCALLYGNCHRSLHYGRYKHLILLSGPKQGDKNETD
jgi:hypothetical protein